MHKDAFWESNLINEQQRAQADAEARNDSGTESDENLPIAATLGTNTKKKIVPLAAGRDGAKPRPKGLKEKKQPHQRWEYVPVIPDQDIVSQYWDTLPSSVRVARNAANVKLHQCKEDENQPVGVEVDDTEANGAAVDATNGKLSKVREDENAPDGVAADESQANGVEADTLRSTEDPAQMTVRCTTVYAHSLSPSHYTLFLCAVVTNSH